MPVNQVWIWCPNGFLLQSLLLELNRLEKQTCQNRPETQLGRHTGKRNMNLLEPKRLVKASMWQTVCNKVVCERWYVTKCVWKRMMSVKREAGGWCVTKMCVRELLTKIVWKMVCNNTLRQMVCDKDGMWQKVCDKDVCDIVPRLPRKTKADVRLCHACHAKRRWMWDCATPATWNTRRCHLVPRLPRKVPRRHGRLKPDQARHPVPWVPRLPRKTKVDVRLCHACHVKHTSMSPSATPCHACHAKCHACHAKCRGVTGA